MQALSSLLPEPSEDSKISSTEANATHACQLCGVTPTLCQGMGVVREDVPFGHPNFGKLFRCPNHRVEANPQRREALLRASHLDALQDKTFARFELDLAGLKAEQRLSLELAVEIAQAFADQPEGWLVFEGGYGCGKTHLAAAIGNQCLARGETVLFITVPDLLDHLRATYAPTSEIAYDDLFDRVRNVPLLILDDLGTENQNAWALEKLFQLLNHRHVRRLPTVITTNIRVDKLEGRISSRLLDEKLVHLTKIAAPDYRTVQTGREQKLSALASYAAYTFSQFDLKLGLNAAEQAELKREYEAAKEFAETIPPRWLLFLGKNYGCGKTHLAAAIGHEAEAQGVQTVFITVPDLLDYLRDAFNPDSKSSFDQRFESLRTVKLLILDDLGLESAKPWAKEKLFQLLEYRYVRRLSTVITSSLPTHAIDPRLGVRFMDNRVCSLRMINVPDFPSRLRASGKR
jgi:DNA replication protein DnaC